MKKILASMSLLAFAGMTASAPGASNDDLLQIRALETRFATAMTNKDLDAAMNVYVPGKALFVFDVVGPPSVHESWEQYREAWKHFLAMFRGPLTFAIDDLDVEASGDVAYSRSLQHVSGIRAKDGKPYDITARVTDVYRNINGKWLIVQEHASLALDRETLRPILHSTLPPSR